MEGFVIPLIILFLICDNGQYVVCHKVNDSNNAPQHAPNVQGEQNNLLKSTHKSTDYANFCGPNSRSNVDYVRKNCINMSDRLYKGCFMCRNNQLAHGSDNQTICFAHRDQIPSIFQSLSSYNDTITSLEIVVNYEWHHHYMYQFHQINLTNIRTLIHLKKFALTPILGHENYYSQSYLKFNNNTFENLNDLRILQINIPILDCSSSETGPDCVGLEFMIAPLVSLEVLDLSLTKYLSAHTVRNVTKKLSNNISKLCLITFQTIGSSLYTNALDMKILFSNRIFENLIYLDLSENDITVFKPGIYSTAPNLTVFSLSGNILLAEENLPLIIESLLHPQMVTVDMDYQGFISGSIPRNGRDVSNIITVEGPGLTMAEKAKDSSIHKTVNSSTNRTVDSSSYLFTRLIHCINMHTIQEGNSNASRLFSGSIEEQKHIMTSILACTFPVAFIGVSHELIPPLRNMYDESCAASVKLPVGQSLQAVWFSHIHWELSGAILAFLSGKICFSPNNVTEITLNDNAAWMPTVTSHRSFLSLTQVTGLDKLEAFAFNRNNMTIDLSLLRDISNLKHLSLAGNRITSNYGFKLCSYLKHLKQLDLANSVHDPRNFSTLLADCYNLINLSLAHNSLTSTDISHLNLTASASLKQLNFNHNSMNTIDFKFIKDIQRWNNSKLYLDFSENMFLCGCNETHLIDGFETVNNSKLNIEFINYKDYKCVSPVGIACIGDVINSQNRYFSQCPDKIRKEVYSALGGVFGFICVIICIVLMFRYRWKIRYKQHKLREFCRRNRPDDEIKRKSYKYDAFVAYCAEDRFWVHDVLMKTLEDVYSFRLCIHYRDFEPGAHITDEITKNIHHASHKVILVITDRFFRSGWCSFELKQALLRSRNEGHNNLIFVKVGEINNTGSEEAMMVLNTYNYIEWVDVQSGKDLFWARLVSALYGEDHMDRNQCGCCCFPSGADQQRIESAYQRIP